MDIERCVRRTSEGRGRRPGAGQGGAPPPRPVQDAFDGEDDVVEDVIASGSLARSTQREPINDVDVIIVFDAEPAPRLGRNRARAPRRRSKYTGKRVNALLGATQRDLREGGPAREAGQPRGEVLPRRP